jgi:hypothetical protein
MPYIATLAFSQSAEKKGVRRTMYNKGEYMVRVVVRGSAT